MTEAQRLREQAARCLRLAHAVLHDEVSERLRELAADYLEKAQALEHAAKQQQHQQVGHLVPRPSRAPGAAQQQQQQQVQPKKDE